MAVNHTIAQTCPACGGPIDTTDADPLMRIPCPKCGEKVRVERSFDNFVLLETLGIGGMGTVYKARDTVLDRLVALKLLRKDLGEENDYGRRLQQEARVAASINHPNVIQVFSSGKDHEQFYLVMELVDHGSLDDLIEQRERLAEERVLEAGVQVAKGLRAAYRKGLIHRDIKPANILFADEQTAKIGDFGLAGVAAEAGEMRGHIWGTPYYVAPERLDSKPEDFRSDIYSLGATLFHAMAGRAPIEGETNSATALRELKRKPLDIRSVAPDVSPVAARIFQRMLAPNPADRFDSYDELLEEMQKAHGALTQELEIGGAQKKALPIAMAAFLLTGLVVGSFVLAFKHKVRVGPERLVAPAVTIPLSELERQFRDARHELLIGHHKIAQAAFARIAVEAKGNQPLYDWVLLNQGLAAMVGRDVSQARQALETVEDAGEAGFAKQDTELARFFVATAKMMSMPGPLVASTVPQSHRFESFGLLLCAFKDVEQKDVSDAIVLLERFTAATPDQRFGWVEEYKPLGRKLLEDARLYADWKKQTRDTANTGQLSAKLQKLRQTKNDLKVHTALVEDLASEERSLALQVIAGPKVEINYKQLKKALETENPKWQLALDKYRKRLALYDFAGARDAVSAVNLSVPSLREEQASLRRRAGWLVEWKNKLIDDLNRVHFSGVIADRRVQYTGIDGASAQSLSLRNPYGSARLPWTKLTPRALLTVSMSFIKPNAPDGPDREWLSAVYAAETGEAKTASELGERAAAAKPEYRAEISLLNSTLSTR